MTLETKWFECFRRVLEYETCPHCTPPNCLRGNGRALETQKKEDQISPVPSIVKLEHSKILLKVGGHSSGLGALHGHSHGVVVEPSSAHGHFVGAGS